MLEHCVEFLIQVGMDKTAEIYNQIYAVEYVMFNCFAGNRGGGESDEEAFPNSKFYFLITRYRNVF